MDLCGIEYVVDERDGEAYFYDLNALSNFVADAPNVIGFDPFVNLVDLIEFLSHFLPPTSHTPQSPIINNTHNTTH